MFFCYANSVLGMERARRLASAPMLKQRTIEMSCSIPTKISSMGILIDDPWTYSLPVFIVQVSLAIVLTRGVMFILKPLRAPKVVSEIIAGVILGPSFLGRNQKFKHKVFPVRGKPLLGTVAYIALIYFHFIIGVKQDPMVIRTSGRKGIVIAAFGVLVPSLISIAVIMITSTSGERHHGPFFIFLCLYTSITTFPVVSTHLAELNLLNSELGKLSLSASMLNDIIAWLFTAVSFAMRESTPIKFFTIILVFFLFIVFLVFVVRPVILWIIRRTPEGRQVKEIYITAVLASVLIFGFIAEFIGASIIYGPLLFGLVIPSGPPLGSALVERLESITTGFFMPVFFIVSGLNTDLSVLSDFSGWNFAAIIFLGCMGKFLGTMLPSLYYKIDLRDSFLLALFMNSKGIIELVTINRFKDQMIMTDQTFVLVLLSVMIISSIISPVMSSFYDPQRVQRYAMHKHRTIQSLEPGTETSIIACIQSPRNVPAIISLIQLSHPTKRTPICLYPLQLVELHGRAAPLLIAHDGRSELQPQSETANILNALQRFFESSSGGLSILPFTSIAPFLTIHQEICYLADDKKACLVILPFHKQLHIDGTMEAINQSFRSINQNVLQQAPCSVGILIDRGLGGVVGASAIHITHVALLFLGGVDDREALYYVARMAQNPLTSLTILRLIPPVGEYDSAMESVTDEEVLNDFRRKTAKNARVAYEEREVSNVEETVSAIRHMGNAYNLIVVGRGSKNKSPLVVGLEEWCECPELGAIGDLLSSEFGGTASVFVVQQYIGNDGQKGVANGVL